MRLKYIVSVDLFGSAFPFALCRLVILFRSFQEEQYALVITYYIVVIIFIE